jgi:hypothetical protein
LTTHAALIGELQARRAFPDPLGPKGQAAHHHRSQADRHDVLPFVWNVFTSVRNGEPVMADDPWGYGLCSQRLAFGLHYPHIVERLRDETHVRRIRRETDQDDAVAVGGQHPERGDDGRTAPETPHRRDA